MKKLFRRKTRRSVIVATYPDGRRFIIERIRLSDMSAAWTWREGESCHLLEDAIKCAELAGAVITRERVH